MTLTELLAAGDYPTDKREHPLLIENYERLFAPWQSEVVHLLELGNDRGGSLRLWRDYFPEGRILGVDQSPLPDLGERILTYTGKQDNAGLLQHISDTRTGGLGWDFVIDDCSHLRGPTEISFQTLWPYVRAGGWYCIEDWGTGYWPSVDGALYHPNHASGMVGFVKSLVDEVATPDWSSTLGNGRHLTTQVKSVTFYHGHVLVEKQ